MRGYLALLPWMCCPFCGGSLAPGAPGAADFNTLVCDCSRHPVVAGIPILKREGIGTHGEGADEICQLIDAGRHRDALLAMIMPPAPASPSLAPAWVRAWPSVKGVRMLQRAAHGRHVAAWRQQAAARLEGSWDDVTACEILDLYYRRSGFAWHDAYDYFRLRFGQPRHLVALSLTTLINEPAAPILDLACGFGHLTRSLASRAGGQPVIGADQTFIGLYLAKRLIAPEGDYVCCNADGPLPFRDRSFSTVFCSDAFHYFVHKSASVRDLRRILQEDGILAMVWMHNKQWRRPHDGLPLSPDGYSALVADLPHRMVADSQILARYLKKQGPPLACSTGRQGLSEAPLVSLVASRRQDIFTDHGTFDDWPHAFGRLCVNPLYRVEERGALVRLRRTFPSEFYLEEHAESMDYLPDTVDTSAQALRDLTHGHRTADVDTLVNQFVALGMPDRYV